MLKFNSKCFDRADGSVGETRADHFSCVSCLILHGQAAYVKYSRKQTTLWPKLTIFDVKYHSGYRQNGSQGSQKFQKKINLTNIWASERRGGKKSEKKCSIVETKQMSVAHVVLRKCVVCIVLSLCFGYKVLWLQCMFTHNIWMVTLTMNNTHTHTLNPISLKWKSISAQTVFNVESRAQCKCVRS